MFFAKDGNLLNDEKDLLFPSLNISICAIDFILNFLNRCEAEENTNSSLSFDENSSVLLLVNFTDHQHY